MTREEAIKFLKSGCLELACEYHTKNRCNDDYEVREARKDESLQMAIADMEKQIPKKIHYVKQSYGTPFLCTECEADQIKVEFFRTDGSEPEEKVSYCWKCGQALDWSEE